MTSSVLNIESWNPSEIKYGLPKKSKVGKSINAVSTQTNKYLKISMPKVMTWGIADFYDKDKDTHDGKFSITLAFPLKENETDKTRLALEKLKQFQDQILLDACKNKAIWFDDKEDIDDAMVKMMMYKFVKYPKNKETKKIDYTKPPSVQAKVEQWEGKWKSRIFDTKKQLLFPTPETEGLTPADFVPKLSNVSCTIECAGVWIGEKGWGVTWKLDQCVVKPNESMTNSDVCQVDFDDEDANNINNQKTVGDDVDVDIETGIIYKSGVPIEEPTKLEKVVEESTKVEDSDDEEAPPPVKVAEVPEPIKKKVIKKKASV
jgi:hypothetical protein